MDIIRLIAKTGGIEILKALKEDNLRWSELMKVTGLNSHTLSIRTRELIDAGLIIVKYDQIGRYPIYILTTTGKRILKLLEEIEKIHSDFER
jgi:DNA-binding HxlR family transcriptional regulator